VAWGANRSIQPLVTPAATSTSPTPTPTAFARRVRALRVALIVALVVAVPLVVALVTHSNRSGVEDAYRAQARADATAVARAAVREPRARLARELERVRSTVPDVAGIEVFRRTGSEERPIAASGNLGGGLVVEAPGSGGRVARVAWDLERVDAAIAARNGGFPVVLSIAVAAAALLMYGLISLLGLRRLARLAREMAEGHQSLEALALEDPLTGLPNKRAFNDRLAAELGRAAREYYPVSVVAMDLDKFKQINDTWGHAVGDEALIKLSRALQSTLRAGDLCGRLGGDEFMLALVRADAPTAEKVMQRIKEAVAPIEVGPDRVKLKFSAGIAEFPRHSTEMDQLINQADAALYWGKAHGRDRWHIYSAEAGQALGADTGTPNDGVRRRNMLATLQQLAKAVDAKNRYTTDHSDRVSGYAVALAKSLKLHDGLVERVRTAALLHDVGKIGVPTPVLLKDGPLNLDDLDQLARHSELGHAMIAGAGMPEEARVVFHVHERWDGGGFPDKLAGDAIPVESRIIGAADALDRATRPTAHRRIRPLREALAELEFCAGTKLDPDVCARLVSMVRGGEIEVPGHETRPHRVGDRRAAASI
jgi:diguanylate cyclase (GGDEF)-like protein